MLWVSCWSNRKLRGRFLYWVLKDWNWNVTWWDEALLASLQLARYPGWRRFCLFNWVLFSRSCLGFSLSNRVTTITVIQFEAYHFFTTSSSPRYLPIKISCLLRYKFKNRKKSSICDYIWKLLPFYMHIKIGFQVLFMIELSNKMLSFPIALLYLCC